MNENQIFSPTQRLNIFIILFIQHLMNFKNSRNIILLFVALMVILVSSLFYLNQEAMHSGGGSLTNLNQNANGYRIIDSIDIQNNVLTNYFNSLYDSQLSDIESKYNNGTISSEERDKQLNAIIKNRELTINTLNKLSNAKKDIFTGNISKQDILIRINSFKDINSDIISEVNATLNGY